MYRKAVIPSVDDGSVSYYSIIPLKLAIYLGVQADHDSAPDCSPEISMIFLRLVSRNCRIFPSQ